MKFEVEIFRFALNMFKNNSKGHLNFERTPLKPQRAINPDKRERERERGKGGPDKKEIRGSLIF
jgi:hypothetical protein